MPRTVSTSLIPGTDFYDLDGRVVDGIEALRLRIAEAIRFRFGTWFLSRRSGLDYDLLISHRLTADIAAQALNATIRQEGGSEIIDLHDLEYSLDAGRVLSYSVRVETIYGDMTIRETI